MALRHALLAGLWPLAALADPAPTLGVATNFSQGWEPDIAELRDLIPFEDVRDAIRWRVAEEEVGKILFDRWQTTFPDRLAQDGVGMSLTVSDGHPLYDDFATPATPEARAGFANFAAVAVERYPNIHSVEVGNEMNSTTFARGPGWDGPIRDRARTYTALLKDTAEAVRAVRPEVRILGGATHSIPLPWFEEIFAQGGADYMDAIVVHPYGTPPEQLVPLIDLLRALPEAAAMPIEITEWGTEDPDDAPGFLLKGYCQFALAGVTRYVWYAINPRGDGLVPLVDAEGRTPTGEAYVLASREFEGREVTDLGIDPFTYGCAFGERAMLLWGAPRDVTLAEGIRVLSPDGREVAAEGLRLDRDVPLVLLSDDPLLLGEEVVLGPHGVIADSFDQFTFPGAGRGPFTLLAEAGGRQVPYETRPGQDRGGVPWSPYLGNPMDGSLFAGDDFVLPRFIGPVGALGPAAVVQRYTSEISGPARLEIDIAPRENSLDGVVLQVRQGDAVLLERDITAPEVVTLDLMLEEGAATDVIVGPGETDEGDVTRLRTRYLERG